MPKTEKEEIVDVSPVYNPLLSALRENDKKNLFQSDVVTYFHKTGFHLYDYYFGGVMNIHDENGKIVKQVGRPGQAAGTFNLMIGLSSSGKTTLASQIAANIIRQYKYSNVIHFDCENRFDVSRAQTITQLPSSYFDPDKGERYIIKSGLIGMDGIQEIVVKTYVSKMKLKDQLLVDTGEVNEYGKPIYIFEPTIIIIDSITSVISETFNPDSQREASEAEKMRGNTEGARDAKTLKGFFKDILPLCKAANIIVFGINHISQNMSMSAFAPVAKQQLYLKQDESIPGGKVMTYFPHNIIKLNAKPSDNFEEEADGITGHIVSVEPIKASSNVSGNANKGLSFDLVFSQKYGFDSLRSLIVYGRANGIIEGNRNRLKFKADPSFTFTFKGINEEKKEKPIWDCIKKYIIPRLEEHLPFVDTSELEFDENLFDY